MASRVLRGLTTALLDEGRAADLQQPPETQNLRPGKGSRGLGRGLAGDPKVEEQLDSYRGTIYAVTTKIADRFARVPTELQQVEVDADGAEERTDVNSHPFLNLLGEGVGCAPNDEDSVYEFKKSHQLSLDLTGEAWWVTERNADGVPARISLLPSSRMKLVIDEETGAIGGYWYNPQGSFGAATGRDQGLFFPRLSFEELRGEPTAPFVTFFRYPSPKGVEDPRGWSPVKSAARAWDINTYEMIYKREFLKNGAQLGGVLQSEVSLSKEEIREYTQQFKELHQGASKAGLPLVLPKFMKWHTTEPTPRDAQWVETVELTKTEILQVYATSETQLGLADVGSRATSEVQEAIFARDVVQPRLVSFEQKLEGQFLPIYPEQTPELHFDIVHPSPVPEDREFELEKAEKDVELGLRTRNEIRTERGDEPYGDFGDRVDVGVAALQVNPWDDESTDEVEDEPPEDGDDDGEPRTLLKPLGVEAAMEAAAYVAGGGEA